MSFVHAHYIKYGRSKGVRAIGCTHSSVVLDQCIATMSVSQTRRPLRLFECRPRPSFFARRSRVNCRLVMKDVEHVLDQRAAVRLGASWTCVDGALCRCALIDDGTGSITQPRLVFRPRTATQSKKSCFVADLGNTLKPGDTVERSLEAA